MTNPIGFDVSHLNGVIAAHGWTEARAAGYSFAYIKATQGTGFVDPHFAGNARNAVLAGFKIGFYHFLDPRVDPEAQADHFLSTLKDGWDKGLQPGLATKALILPHALDVEQFRLPHEPPTRDHWDDLDPSQRVDRVSAWLAEVDKAEGRRCAIYQSPGWWTGKFGHPDFSGHPCWTADYSRNPPRIAEPWKSWTCFQHSESGVVPGIGSGVDLDLWNGPLPG